MSGARFIDTNILLYAYDLDAPAQRATALRIITGAWNAPRGDFVLSVQVLQELYVSLIRKGVTRAKAAEIARDFGQWPVIENTLDLFLDALDEAARWNVSFWDASIIAAAKCGGATELITEDLNNGQDYGGIRAFNPFV